MDGVGAVRVWERKDGLAGESQLELVERLLLLGGPVPLAVLLEEGGEGACNVAVLVDELPVVPCQS